MNEPTLSQRIFCAEDIMSDHAARTAGMANLLRDVRQELKRREAEVDLRAEPSPAGTLAARYNWWRDRYDEVCDELKQKADAGERADHACVAMATAVERLTALDVYPDSEADRSVLVQYLQSELEKVKR